MQTAEPGKGGATLPPQILHVQQRGAYWQRRVGGVLSTRPPAGILQVHLWSSHLIQPRSSRVKATSSPNPCLFL